MAYKEFIVYSKTKAEFEALVSSKEVDNTQMGIIAETGEMWWKGEYRPIAETAPFAKDLTGVLEATPEEFTFRTSAGTKSIRDESAVIRRIKGNTSVWGQLAEWTGIDNKLQSTLATYEISDNSLDITYNQAGAPPQVYIFSSPLYPAVTGHKYLCTIDVKTSKSLGLILYPWYDVFLRFTSNQSWTTYSAFYTPTRTNFTNRFYFRFQAVANQTMEVGDSIHCRNLQFFDLTQIFGAGNEPTTIEEFKKLYPDSYYPYCEPEVRSMRATGIETIGANAFDKDSVVGGLINADGTVTSNDIYSVAKIEVVPNEKYTLTNVANAANTTYTYALYDSNDRFISVGEIKNSVTKPVSVSGDVTMPLNARYMRVVVHNDYLDSCCVNLKHSGTLTAEEAVYFKEVRMLPDIAKYFPEGMHGIGDVFDEINEESAVKRFGVRAYEDGDNDNADVITDGTNTVYILEEPIITPIVEPLQLDYKVADFGTEKMLSNLPSSPFRADIVYQFNAEGRIRDNSRNIERLEEHTKDMATMEDVINAIPTEVATATQRNVVVSGTSFLFLPNILYEYKQSIGEYTIPELVGGNSSYDNVWMLRVSVASSSTLTIPFDVVWENSQAPSFASGAIIELRFRKLADERIIGDWKIYR